MDNELYCPMKMTSNPLGRCVCEKEKCAWWRQLDNCCSVWWIAWKPDNIKTKMKMENVNEWISVEDRLPDVPKNDFASDYVLVHDKKAGDWVAYYDVNGGWCEARECIPFENVTHWMPLPKPPKEV